MIDSERFKLLYGPYEVPKRKLGDKLLCEYRDQEVTVKGMTDALIQWPCTRRRNQLSPIVCGDLVRAIRTESEMAVAHHWGVRSSSAGHGQNLRCSALTRTGISQGSSTEQKRLSGFGERNLEFPSIAD